jgi:hypothetical protein
MKTQRRRSGFDWLALALLLLAVSLASLRLSATEWVNYLASLHSIVIAATLAGLLLGRTRLHGLLCAVLALLAGAAALLLQLGLQVTASGGLWVQIQNALQRLQAAGTQFVNGSNVPDALFFLALMGLVFWGLGANAGFRVTRRSDAWGAALPFVPLFVVLQFYDGVESSRIWYLAAFMLVVLLLAARLRLLSQQNKWKRSHLKVSQYIGADLLAPSLSIIALLVLVAWSMPPVQFTWTAANEFWSDLTKPWREVRNDFSRAFYSIEGSELASGDYYSEALSLGNGNQLSPNIIFTVEVLQQEHRVPRFYWRDRVYDLYEDGEWAVSFGEQQRLSAEAGYGAPLSTGRLLTSLRVTTGKSIQLLHTAPQLISIDRGASATFTRNQDGSLDLAAVEVPTGLAFGQQYEMQSAVTTATLSELRAAGTAYPAWVRQRYLQVPAELTERTRQLAAEIAAGLENPYDIAAAVTSYLRTHIEYQPSLPLPPAGAEPVDWMLFDQKQAFCNYYATAEVMLLRVLGIPARMAVGYAQGGQGTENLLLNEAKTVEERLQEDLLQNTYFTVRERDAHAWPEVFFPGIGWVEFEPTANQQEILRPVNTIDEEPQTLAPLQSDAAPSGEEAQAEPLQAAAAPASEETQAPIRGSANTALWQTVFWIAALAAAIGASFWWRQRERERVQSAPVFAGVDDQEWDTPRVGRLQRWTETARQPALTRAYLEINSALGRLGAKPRPGDTAAARAAALSRELPKLREQILALNTQYQSQLYGKRKPVEEQIGLLTIWRIRWHSFWLGLKRKLTSPYSITGRMLRFSRRYNKQF